MSKQLDELLFTIRQNPAFKELLEAVQLPPLKNYRPGQPFLEQAADYAERSGRRVQHESWVQFLIGEQQEKPK